MNGFAVGVSTSSIEPSLNHGIVDGIGHYTRQLIAQLGKLSIDVKRFAFPSFRSRKAFEHSSSLKWPFSALALGAMASNGRMPRTDVDVDIFHSTDFKVVPMKCPVVATIWDAIPIAHPEWLAGTVRPFLVKHILKHSTGYADHIIAVSEHAAKDISYHFRIKEKRISVVPWAVDDAWFEPIEDAAVDSALGKYSLVKSYFLTVGTLQPRKNLDRLLDAYLMLPEYIRDERQLVIVGKYGWDCEALVSRLKELKEKGQVIWLRNVDSDSELRRIYKGAGVFVFPSLYEGFGVPIVEAFAAGIPVISSEATSLREVSCGAAMEVNAESNHELSYAMRFLHEDSAEGQALIRRGFVRASQLRWRHTLDETVKVYEKVLGRN